MMCSKLKNMRKVWGSSFILLLFYFTACQSNKPVSEAVWTGYTMGTSYQVKVANAAVPQQDYKHLARSIDSVLVEVNRQMSTYIPQSEISVFNSRQSTEPFQVSAGFMSVIRQALDLYRSSEGAFDVTVAPLVNLWGFGPATAGAGIPDKKDVEELKRNVGSDKLMVVDSLHIAKKVPGLQLDLSAIAKGYGVDVVAGFIAGHGFANYMVEIGGEVAARGMNAHMEPWRIGIDRPKYANLPGQDLQGILALKDVAVATSGDYRNYFEFEGNKYSHTIDPKTGRPVTHNLASVTIIAGDCTTADGIATAVMVMGYEKGYTWVNKMSGVEAMLILRMDEDRFEEHLTPGFSNYLAGPAN